MAAETLWPEDEDELPRGWHGDLLACQAHVGVAVLRMIDRGSTLLLRSSGWALVRQVAGEALYRRLRALALGGPAGKDLAAALREDAPPPWVAEARAAWVAGGRSAADFHASLEGSPYVETHLARVGNLEFGLSKNRSVDCFRANYVSLIKNEEDAVEPEEEATEEGPDGLPRPSLLDPQDSEGEHGKYYRTELPVLSCAVYEAAVEAHLRGEGADGAAATPFSAEVEAALRDPDFQLLEGDHVTVDGAEVALPRPEGEAGIRLSLRDVTAALNAALAPHGLSVMYDFARSVLAVWNCAEQARELGPGSVGEQFGIYVKGVVLPPREGTRLKDKMFVENHERVYLVGEEARLGTLPVDMDASPVLITGGHEVSVPAGRYAPEQLAAALAEAHPRLEWAVDPDLPDTLWVRVKKRGAGAVALAPGPQGPLVGLQAAVEARPGRWTPLLPVEAAWTEPPEAAFQLTQARGEARRAARGEAGRAPGAPGAKKKRARRVAPNKVEEPPKKRVASKRDRAPEEAAGPWPTNVRVQAAGGAAKLVRFPAHGGFQALRAAILAKLPKTTAVCFDYGLGRTEIDDDHSLRVMLERWAASGDPFPTVSCE